MSKPNKPKWVKITGLVFISLLVINMILFGIGYYGDLIFWIFIVIFGGASWLLIKKTKNLT